MAVNFKNGLKTTNIEVRSPDLSIARTLAVDSSGQLTVADGGTVVWTAGTYGGDGGGGGGGTPADASTTVKGISKLSVAPISSTDPIAAGDNDPRLTDARTPTDSSVTNAKVASGAAIAESKLDLASDAAAGTASRRTLGTGATQAAAGNHTHTKTYWIAHNFIVGGEVKVPSGQTDLIPPMYVSVHSSGTVKLAKIRYNIEGGTSVTFKLQKNGVDITGYTALSATPAGTPTNTDAADVTLADNDSIQVVVTAVSGTPQNFTVCITLEYSVTN